MGFPSLITFYWKFFNGQTGALTVFVVPSQHKKKQNRKIFSFGELCDVLKHKNSTIIVVSKLF